MKIMLSFAVLFLTPLLAIAQPSNNQLIGHWRCIDGNRSAEITFREDGTFTGNFTQDSEIVWRYAGKWSLADGMLNYEYTKSSSNAILAGFKDRDKLVEIAKDYYIIEAIGTDAKRRKYSRIE